MPAPSTHAQSDAQGCRPPSHPSPQQHSSTVTPTTAELLGSQAVCHGQMPTCRYLETPVPPSINSQAPHPPASSDALLSAPCPGPYPPEYLALAGSHQAVRFLLTSQPEEHHGVTVSSDRSPQHAPPEVSVRTLRGCKDYREAQKYMRALETRERLWMRTQQAEETICFQPQSCKSRRSLGCTFCSQGICQGMPHLGVIDIVLCSITRSIILLITCSARAIRR